MEGDFMTIISASLGVPIYVLVIIMVWSLIWKLIAMWKAAKNNSFVWFIVLALVNTLGILPILYIYIFSKMKIKKKTKKKVKRKKKK